MIQLLIINDNSFTSGRQTVNGIDFDVKLCSSPLEAFNRIIHIIPDAIVINMEQPDMDAVKVYKRIRNMQASREVPVLMFVDLEKEAEYKPLTEDRNTDYFTLPVTQYETFDWVVKKLGVTQPGKQKKVLVVDDDAVVLELTELYLGAKYKVFTANSPSVALDTVRSEHPDIILLDIAMPERDGKELYKDIRAIPECKDTPILFQTGMAGVNTVRECVKLGAAGFVVKPIQKSVLLDRLAECITGNHKTKKKLYVFEDFDFMFSLIQGFAKDDFEVMRGESVLQSLNHVEEVKPDIMLIDLDNSSFIMNRAREKSKEMHIPIVLMTRDMNSLLVQKEKQRLNTSFVKLPLQKDSLLEVLKAVPEWKKDSH